MTRFLRILVRTLFEKAGDGGAAKNDDAGIFGDPADFIRL